MKKIGAIKAGQGAGELRQVRRRQRLERRQRDGEVIARFALATELSSPRKRGSSSSKRLATQLLDRPLSRAMTPQQEETRVLYIIRRHAPVWLSLFAGIALWEIAGASTSPAFMVPFSETLVRLWQLIGARRISRAVARTRAELFCTGFVLALIVGAPLGLLLARVRVLRVGVEPYLMILYATPMVALIPFILSMMGFGFAPKVLVVFLFAVFPVLYNTVEGARSIKPETDRGRAVLPLERMGAVARGDAALHPALHDDRRAPGDRPRAGRHDRRRILPVARPASASSSWARRRISTPPACSPRSSSSADRRRPDAARAR